jgi:hypothetical protein
MSLMMAFTPKYPGEADSPLFDSLPNVETYKNLFGSVYRRNSQRVKNTVCFRGLSAKRHQHDGTAFNLGMVLPIIPIRLFGANDSVSRLPQQGNLSRLIYDVR